MHVHVLCAIVHFVLEELEDKVPVQEVGGKFKKALEASQLADLQSDAWLGDEFDDDLSVVHGVGGGAAIAAKGPVLRSNPFHVSRSLKQLDLAVAIPNECTVAHVTDVQRDSDPRSPAVTADPPPPYSEQAAAVVMGDRHGQG